MEESDVILNAADGDEEKEPADKRGAQLGDARASRGPTRRARHCAASNLKALYFLKGISLDFVVWYEALGMRSGQVGQLLAIGPGMALVFLGDRFKL